MSIRLTIANQELQKLNDSLQKGGKTPIHVREADKNLTDDDLVEMVNAGLIPATITTRERAELWSKVFDNFRGRIPTCRSSLRDKPRWLCARTIPSSNSFWMNSLPSK